MNRNHLCRLLAASFVAGLSLSACGDDDPPTPRVEGPTTTTAAAAASACGEPIPEALDPASGRHLLPGQPDPSYLTDPPTSGAHSSGKYPTGVLADTIPNPTQVSMLEAGQVIIQHQALEKAEFDRLTALATDTVSVAPNPALPGKIVATAWQVKLICSKLDESALQMFITTFLKPEAAH